MAAPTILLHQWEISPFCAKARALLAHKGLAFEVRNYNGIHARKAAGLTPTGTLPVLDYGDERIGDSTAIAAFLEERHPDPPLWPADPRDRALTRIYEDWADESLYYFEVYLRFLYPEAAKAAAASLSDGRSGLERMLMELIFPRMYKKKLTAHGLARMPRDRVEGKLWGHLDDLETLVADRDWLVGDARTIADIAVASQLREMMRTSPLRAEFERRKAVVTFIERTLDRGGAVDPRAGSSRTQPSGSKTSHT